MNIESKSSRTEKEKDTPNAIDADFDTLESDFSMQERMELTRELFGEVFYPPLLREDLYKDISRVREDGKGTVKHYFLPDMPGGNGDLKSIREGYDQRPEYLKSAHRMFLKVGQGEMWVIPRSEKSYFQVSMSECSAILGSDDEHFVIAHISFSAINEIEAVMEFMQSMGIDSENIYAVASVGEYQKKRSDDEYTKRATDATVYTALGIPKSNIQQFEFFPGKVEKDGSWLSHNITQVTGCNDALFTYSFDVRKIPRPGMIFPREERSGEYKDEEIREIKKKKFQ